MMFTVEVDWSPFDFIVAAFLLLSTGFAIEFVWRKITNIKRRFLVVGALLIALFLIWAELAVGIFGSPFAGS